jgi:hypothetical protein
MKIAIEAVIEASPFFRKNAAAADNFDNSTSNFRPFAAVKC